MFWPETPSCGWVVSTPSMTKRFSEPEAPSIEMPPRKPSWAAPAACVATPVKSRPLGSSSICSALIEAAVAELLTSTWPASPTTLIVSETAPTSSVTFAVTVSPRRTATFVTSAGLKPSSFAITT